MSRYTRFRPCELCKEAPPVKILKGSDKNHHLCKPCFIECNAMIDSMILGQAVDAIFKED